MAEYHKEKRTEGTSGVTNTNLVFAIDKSPKVHILKCCTVYKKDLTVVSLIAEC